MDADKNGLWRQGPVLTVFVTFESQTGYFGSRVVRDLSPAAARGDDDVPVDGAGVMLRSGAAGPVCARAVTGPAGSPDLVARVE